ALAENIEIDGVQVGFVEKCPADVAGSDPAIFDSREPTFVESDGALCSPSQSTHVLVQADEYDENKNWNQQEPSGNDLADREPNHSEKEETSRQPCISDAEIESSKALDITETHLETLAVFLRRIHFSSVQKLFTSEDMLPRSEFKPDPSPNRPPRTARM